MFNHVSTYCYSLMNQQGLFAYVRTTCTEKPNWCNTKFMVVVTSLFNLVISSFPDNMFYHAWTWLLIYHDGSNDVVQVCSFIKRPWTVCSNMHEKACQQHFSSWPPAQPCSSLSTGKNKLCIFIQRTFKIMKKINLKFFLRPVSNVDLLMRRT